MIKRKLSTSVLTALLSWWGIAACKSNTQVSQTLDASTACSAQEKKVADLEAELKASDETAIAATSAQKACTDKGKSAKWNTETNRCECTTEPTKFAATAAQITALKCEIDVDSFEACKEVAGTKWNTEIGRCECKTDPTKFQGNAWSIRNTLKCEAAVDSFDECKKVGGAKWNDQIGRCECITDPTKFQGNAWSIRNNLKCQVGVDSFEACKTVGGAKWNDDIGRCECTNDPTKFQGNAWSIRNALKCSDTPPEGTCPQGGSFNPSLGECQCEDGTAYSNYTGTPCKTGAGLTGSDDGFFLARSREDITKDLEAAKKEVEQCKATQSSTDSKSQPPPTPTSKKTTSDAPPATKVDTQPVKSSPCKCSWDSNYRYCVVFKDGKAMMPYVGPVSRSLWACGDNTANDLCNRSSLAGVKNGAQCK
jgi:hypothetical protein